MLLLGRKTAKARVATFLLKLVRQAAERGRPGLDLFIPMTRQMIGDYLGITTETVSRTFTALKREGLISLAGGHHVTLSDVERLQDLAES